MKNLDHPNIIKFYESEKLNDDENNLYAYLEYMNGDSLRSQLNKLNEKNNKNIKND